ncbi:MAG: hypothetical protein OEO79_09980 [Gemmatimonadota bacterium]|nr:hypothetical protein [Gemmatimonadota bacterium]MDH3422634.1 hypothetical protein [Gemmatimonadota bacterium]
MFRRLFLVCTAVLSVVAGLTGCSGEGMGLPAGTTVTVDVTSGRGSGGGTVMSQVGTVPPTFVIDCRIADTTRSEFGCKDSFGDAGGGGSFPLVASPDAGSQFVRWTGCDPISGTSLTCSLSFAPASGDIEFNVTARFEQDACYEVKTSVPNSIAGTGPATPANLEPTYEAEALANSSFEQVVTIGTNAQLLPNAIGYWQGDRNSRVGAQQGVSPNDGSFMAQFIASGIVPGPTGTAELIQLVKVSHLEPDVSNGLVRATVTARFNRVAGCAETDTNMLIVVAAMPGDPSESQARWSAGLAANIDGPVPNGWLGRFRPTALTSDADPATWEELRLVFDVPAGTTYLVVDLGATENVRNDDVFPELHGHYVDRASLVLSRITP